MADLDRALERLRSYAGVEHVLVLGRDGLLIQHSGEGPLDVETTAAMIPGIASASAALGSVTDGGSFATAVLQMSGQVAVIASLSSELLLAILLRADVGFAPLLRELAEQREQLATLI